MLSLIAGETLIRPAATKQAGNTLSANTVKALMSSKSKAESFARKQVEQSEAISWAFLKM
jgi:hypothetical protein